jgi:hypothetical protein
MKSKLLLFLLLWCYISSGLYAQQHNGVTVTELNVGIDNSITFKIEWGSTMTHVWSDTVWVFADYNDNGVMKRLPLTSGAAFVTTSAPGESRVEDVNADGAKVVGNARSLTNTSGSFSATVKLLTSQAGVSGVCVYASNYPPTGNFSSPVDVSFTGTQPYELVVKKEGGGTETRTSGDPFSVPASYTLVSFTDATGAPGRITPLTYTLNVSATAFCVGGTGVTFALSGTQKGVSYQLYKDGAATGTPLSGMGAPATFTETFNEGGDYTARSVGEDAYVETEMDGTRTVTPVALPSLSTIVAANVCQGADLVFGVNSPIAGGTYTWSGSDGTMSGTGNATYTVSGAVAGQKDVTVNVQTTTSGIVCTSADASGSATVVTMPAAPTISVVSGICINSGDLKFMVTSSPGTFDWTGSSEGTPSVTTSPTGMATYTVSGATAGVKTVKVIAQVTQNDLTCATAEATKTAEVYNLPVITGQPTAYLLVDLNNPFSLSVTAQPGSGTTLSYQWKRNGSSVANGGAAVYTAAGTANAGGAYNVVVSNAYTCAVTSSNARIDVQDLPPSSVCSSFVAGKIGSSATGSCEAFDAGAVGISLACYQFIAGSIGK